MNAAYFDQFNIKKLLYIKYSETILSISNLTIVLTTIIIIILITNNSSKKLLPGRNWTMLNHIHKITQNLTTEHIASKNKQYNTLVAAILILITTINLTGLLPYVFTATSHIIITISLSLTIIIKTSISAIITHKNKFFSIFTPHNTPLPLAPFLIVIESTSYITRIISLGVRLAANISAGHLLLTILSKFTLNIILTNHYILSIIPIIILFLITLLEIIVALVQAYVFTLLTTIYISDSIQLH
uniref:ATP synthase subunit a n=1 Tax=Iphiteon panicea TaxID=436082 RepID=A6YHJ4_9METZ|nr:ATP synthase F0 subunit 6 [Iphiteon panicea]